MKMYILVLEEVPVGHAINSAAHASVACVMKYQEDEDVKHWLEHSFRKVTCKVTKAELKAAMELETEYVIITESNLDDKITAVAFKPKEEYHSIFRMLKLYN